MFTIPLISFGIVLVSCSYGSPVEDISQNSTEIIPITKEKCKSTSFFSSCISFNTNNYCHEEDITSFFQLDFKNASIPSPNVDQLFKFTRPTDQKTVFVQQRKKQKWRPSHAFNREVKILKKIKGEGITADIDCTFEDNAGFLYYMMEDLQGTPLDEAEYYIPEKDNFNVIWGELCLKMATKIKMMQEKNILHLNPMPYNWILTKDGEIYITDFEKARTAGHVWDNNFDAIMLGNSFSFLAERMFITLGYHLKLSIDNLYKLKKELSQLPTSSKNHIDFFGIHNIVKGLQSRVERNCKVSLAISALHTFLGKYRR